MCNTWYEKSANEISPASTKALYQQSASTCVSTGSSFKYLGRYLDFQMSNYMHKSELIDMTNTILALIDQFFLQPKYKTLLQSRQLLLKCFGISL